MVWPVPGQDGSDDRLRQSTRADATGSVGGLIRRGAKSVLARWVMAQRRRRTDPSAHAPSSTDEATHAWDGRRRFAEDYTFTCVQPGLGIVARLEWLPGRDANRLWLTVLRDGKAYSLPGGQIIQRSATSDRWRSGGMVLDCLVPLSEWTVRYVGDLVALDPGGPGPVKSEDGTRIRCSLDLTFVAGADPYTPGSDDDPDLMAANLGRAQWDRELLRSVRRVTSRGYVQVGDMQGTLALADELVPIRGHALRQHTWGVRDWGAADYGFQCFAVADDGSQTWVHHVQFPFVTVEGGFVSHGDNPLSPIQGLDITWERRPNRAPAHATLGIPSENGRAALELSMCSDSAFVVDGRGLVELGLARIGTARGAEPAANGGVSGWAMWGAQRRWLPRP